MVKETANAQKEATRAVPETAVPASVSIRLYALTRSAHAPSAGHTLSGESADAVPASNSSSSQPSVEIAENTPTNAMQSSTLAGSAIRQQGHTRVMRERRDNRGPSIITDTYQWAGGAA